ncbi:amidohydrolase [Sinanaerobacter chloroacetimidivorans]|uniref:Amidohydrolase n=1 Tax=Sinanaerobacter chloroacetimidivorans TaxID=2818044 RepID=A0A8J7W7M8_9FIRM|nr:amidohydrolase [Sinanaerobacter chloroacetimidivorans]MBR0600436.1 amidohydrolase [Sinanaerobacter chloroacetimidivorans]
MLFQNIKILDEKLNCKDPMYVGIKGDKIDYIGTEAPKEDYGESYDGRGKLLMSGFFNSHAHTPMTLMRGYGENMSLQDWLTLRIFPFEDKLNGEAVYYGMLLGIAESLRFGIVSTTDMYYFGDEMARAILESGVKNNLGRGVVNFTDEPPDLLPGMQETKHLFETYHNEGGGRLKVDISLHGEYTSNPKTAEYLAGYARANGANMHVHVSETQFETEECKKRHGMTPVQYLNARGIFDARTTAAHCVWLEEDDFDILAQKGVTVASCPVSNLKLASGVCNVPLLLKKGVNVAIGTDSVASNNSLNIIEEMKFFAVANKGKQFDPTLITPAEALTAATAAGAKGQGRDDTGKLAVGYKADLIVLDLMQPNMVPIHNMVNNIVYAASGSDILLTMVDGRVLYRNGEYLTIDMEKTLYGVEKAIERILGELK